MNTKKFVHLDGEGKTWGIVSTEQLWANVYALKYNRPETKLNRETWKKLFEVHGCKVFCEMEEWSLSVKGGI